MTNSRLPKLTQENRQLLGDQQEPQEIDNEELAKAHTSDWGRLRVVSHDPDPGNDKGLFDKPKKPKDSRDRMGKFS